MRLPARLPLALSGIGLLLIAASVVIVLGRVTGAESLVGERTVGVLTIKSAKAQKAPMMRREDVEAIARQAVAEQLARTQATAAESGAVYASFNGRPAVADDLNLLQTTFAAGTERIVSETGGAFSAGRPFDAWMVVFHREGTAVPEWGLTDGLFESTVVIDDATGRVRAAGVRVVNPREAHAPPPLDRKR